MLIRQDRFPIKEIVLFGFLPGFLKKLIYRLRGYRIGKKVSIGIGAVISGKDVSIGDHTTIGFFTIIRGRRIAIGPFVSIGAATILDTPNLEIGEGTKINEQVFVGGLQFPDSRLTVGKNCQIMQMSFINPTTSITIGDDTGIGGDCLLFGHTSWLSAFEGYPVKFEPIEIGNSVSISWRVFVLPGTRIGDGAVIGANSLVHRTIPGRCLAVGFPARVVSSAPDFPRPVSDAEKADLLRSIVAEMMRYFSDSGLLCRTEDERHQVVQMKKAFGMGRRTAYHLRVFYDEVTVGAVDRADEKMDVLLSLRALSPDVKAFCERKKIMWIDIERKQHLLAGDRLGDEVVMYLKRYGVRMDRIRAGGGGARPSQHTGTERAGSDRP